VGFLSFALNYSVGGLQVFGYHLVNLIIHIANGFLVYSLVLLLFKAESQHSPLTTHDSQPNIASWIALAAALLFVAHPIQTQAVTYIVQRFASLVTLFYLITVVCYLKWRLASSETRSRFLWYGAAVLSTVLAMKTKENSFTLPFMILLVEGVFFRSSTRRRWLALIPFLLTLPIIPLSHPGAIGEGEAGFAQETAEISRSGYLFTQFRVIVTYLRLLILPIGQNLDYDYRIYHSILEPAVLLSFLFLLSIFILSLFVIFHSRLTAQDSRLRLMGFGIVWFFLTLAIESSIIPIKDVIFEHRLYLPSAGFFMALSIAVVMGREWLHRQGIPAVWGVIGFGVMVLVLSAMTYQRNHVWHDAMTLWQDVVKKAPQKPRGHYNLGLAYQDKGMLEAAIPEYQKVLALKPDYADAHNNLGNVYKTQGRVDEAIEVYQRVLTLKPDFAEAHNNLANIYTAQGHLGAAIQMYQRALELKPDYAEAHNNLGIAYTAQGRFDEAVQVYQRALLLETDLHKAHYNLGNAYVKRGLLEAAIREYQAAATLKPGSPHYHYTLASAYTDSGRLDDAIREYKTTLRFQPDFPEAHYALGNAYAAQGRMADARQEYHRALTLKPDYAEAHNNLGNVYTTQGRLEDAIKEYQGALKVRPDFAEAYYNLGHIYRKLGRIAEAREVFERALKIKPDYGEVRQALASLSAIPAIRAGSRKR
jgi:tetratricopeptide (TPR) repeat protein